MMLQVASFDIDCYIETKPALFVSDDCVSITVTLSDNEVKLL